MSRIQSALRLMDETLDDPPPLESFAKAAGLSPSQFCKAFKRSREPPRATTCCVSG